MTEIEYRMKLVKTLTQICEACNNIAEELIKIEEAVRDTAKSR